jgi:hypothetical protein
MADPFDPQLDTYIPYGDHFISQKFQMLAEIIRDFDPHLELRWIPPDRRDQPGDSARAYAIVDTTTQYVAIYASETEQPEAILERLFLNDTSKHDVLARLDAHDRAQKVFKLKKQMDETEEAHDIAGFLMKSPLNRVKIHNKAGELITLDDQRRRVE